MFLAIDGGVVYMKKICCYCGKIVEADHNCPNKPKDTRKKDINSGEGGSKWRKVRQQVRERDLCCKLCWYNGTYSKGEEVHHIIPREHDNVEQMVFNPDNCIFLCRDCHHKVHEDGWKKYVKLFRGLIIDSKK